ncbi:MAG: sulfatase-like hydrolase/transferase [Luteibaculaceae bacterium]
MLADLQFVLLFLGLNFLGFSLGYLINAKEQPNPFYFAKKVNFLDIEYWRLNYQRNSSDFLRFNLELSVLLLVFCAFSFHSTWVAHLIALVGLWGLINITYIFTIAYFYKRTPMLQADLSFVKVGLTIAKNRKYILFLLLFVLLLLFYFIFYSLARLALSLEVSYFTLGILFVVVCVLGLKQLFTYNYVFLHLRAVVSPTLYLIRNVKNASKYLSLLTFKESEILSKNIYKSIALNTKPDIVLISVESFGSVAYKDPDIFRGITETLHNYASLFEKQGIYSASSYSKAPQFAGGSWLSVGSILYGYKLEHDTQYNAVFKMDSEFRKYQSMVHYFKEQGYYTAMIAPLGGYEDHQINWEQIKNVYPMDSFVTWKSLQYTGKTLQFMHVGYNPPDQYSLWKGMELLDKESEKPKFTVFPTLNSHCNWHSPITLEDDFSRLNQTKDFDTTKNTKKPSKENYTKAINYQLQVIFDYIGKHPEKIYVIFGDHQPPFVTPEELGFYTPIFVFSANKHLISEFQKEGFDATFLTPKNVINHEGFYSLFMKCFLKTYGPSQQDFPVLREGIKF